MSMRLHGYEFENTHARADLARKPAVPYACWRIFPLLSTAGAGPPANMVSERDSIASGLNDSIIDEIEKIRH